MTSSDPSSRSRTVRRAAKDLLRQFREERRQRAPRGAHAPAAPQPMSEAPAQEASETVLRASPRAEMLARAAASEGAQAQPAQAQSTEEKTVELAAPAEPEASAEVEAPPPLEAAFEAEAEQPTLEEEPAEGAESPADMEIEAVEHLQGEPAEAQEAAPAAPAPSDLDQMPGVGPGLIWVLQQAGVDSIAALANANADDLRGHLGVIGELVDIDSWIEWAKARDAA